MEVEWWCLGRLKTRRTEGRRKQLSLPLPGIGSGFGSGSRVVLGAVRALFAKTVENAAKATTTSAGQRQQERSGANMSRGVGSGVHTVTNTAKMMYCLDREYCAK